MTSKLRQYLSTLQTGLAVSLVCPKCNEPLFLKEASFVCQNHHCYDCSAKGYTHLSLAGKAAHYDKALFANRRYVIEQNFFAPLEAELAAIIRAKNKQGGVFLDAGCGEGSHLSHLQACLTPALCGCAVGIDIAADSILLAAKNRSIFWFVADIGALPFADNTFDFVLDILSPAHYKEFSRVLKPDGTLIKVLPGAGYLQELRDFFFDKSQKNAYDNRAVKEHFYEHYPQACETSLCDRYTLNDETREVFLRSLAQMTPLTQNSKQKALDDFSKSHVKGITVAFTILVGDNAGQHGGEVRHRV